MSNSSINQIVYEIEYGSIKINLDTIMNKRNISNYELSTKANIRFQTIQTLRENTATRIDFDVLAKICYALNCKVSDIIEYVPKSSRE